MPQVVKENLEVIKVPQERGCAPCARRDRRVGEVGLTGTSAAADRRGDDRFGESWSHRNECSSGAPRTIEVVSSAPQERVQQRTAEQMVELPQSPGETVGAVMLVLRERVQQRSAEQIVELPQSPGETVDAVMLVLRERVQQRSAEQTVMWPQPPWWSDEDPSSEEVEHQMRAKKLSGLRRPEGGACVLTGGKGGIELPVVVFGF